jgi:hypothetical protein
VLGSNDKIDRCPQLRRPALVMGPDIGKKYPNRLTPGERHFSVSEIKKASDIAGYCDVLSGSI